MVSYLLFNGAGEDSSTLQSGNVRDTGTGHEQGGKQAWQGTAISMLLPSTAEPAWTSTDGKGEWGQCCLLLLTALHSHPMIFIVGCCLFPIFSLCKMRGSGIYLDENGQSQRDCCSEQMKYYKVLKDQAHVLN